MKQKEKELVCAMLKTLEKEGHDLQEIVVLISDNSYNMSPNEVAVLIFDHILIKPDFKEPKEELQ